jgi:hypothetical protein
LKGRVQARSRTCSSFLVTICRSHKVERESAPQIFERRATLEDRSVAVDVMATILRVVFGDEVGRIFPAGAVRDELDGQAQSRIVVLHEALVGPRRTVRIDVERAAAVIVRIVQVFSSFTLPGRECRTRLRRLAVPVCARRSVTKSPSGTHHVLRIARRARTTGQTGSRGAAPARTSASSRALVIFHANQLHRVFQRHEFHRDLLPPHPAVSGVSMNVQMYWFKVKVRT